MATITVLFKSPKEAGEFVKIDLPQELRENIRYRMVDELAKDALAIANGTKSFKNFPTDDVALLAVTIAQMCTSDEEERQRVADIGRAIIMITCSDKYTIPMTERSMALVREKISEQ
jgi:hypothetical protein